MTTTTEYSSNPRPSHVVAIVRQGDQRLGHVVMRGQTSFRACRKNGEAGVDIRCVSNFRSAQTAAAWIARSAR